MKVVKMSISLDPDLDRDVRDAAKKSGESYSAWMAEAAARRLRSEGLRAFLDDYEGEHGAFSEDELAAARQRLGL